MSLCLADSWIGCVLLSLLIGWLVGWLASWLAGWLVGWCLSWCTGWMVGRCVGLVPLVDRSVIWSAACLFGGLDGLLVVCVTYSVGRS